MSLASWPNCSSPHAYLSGKEEVLSLTPEKQKRIAMADWENEFLRRFIFNTAGRLRSRGQLLRIKEKEQFVWTEAHQKVFNSIKQYQTKPPVLMPPKQGPASDLVFISLWRINGMLSGSFHLRYTRFLAPWILRKRFFCFPEIFIFLKRQIR